MRHNTKTSGEFRITKWELYVGSDFHTIPVYHVLDRKEKHPAYKAVVLHDPDANRTQGEKGKTILRNDCLVALHRAVEAFLMGMDEIEWEPWIRVSRAHKSRWNDDTTWEGSSAGFEAETLELGTDPKGNKFYRSNSRDTPKQGTPPTADYSDTPYSYIKDTPETRESLQKFACALGELEKHMEAFMQQEGWIERLQGLSSMSKKLLPLASKPPQKKLVGKKPLKRGRLKARV